MNEELNFSLEERIAILEKEANSLLRRTKNKDRLLVNLLISVKNASARFLHGVLSVYEITLGFTDLYFMHRVKQKQEELGNLKEFENNLDEEEQDAVKRSLDEFFCEEEVYLLMFFLSNSPISHIFYEGDSFKGFIESSTTLYFESLSLMVKGLLTTCSQNYLDHFQKNTRIFWESINLVKDEIGRMSKKFKFPEEKPLGFLSLSRRNRSDSRKRPKKNSTIILHHWNQKDGVSEVLSSKDQQNDSSGAKSRFISENALTMSLLEEKITELLHKPEVKYEKNTKTSSSRLKLDLQKRKKTEAGQNSTDFESNRLLTSKVKATHFDQQVSDGFCDGKSGEQK